MKESGYTVVSATGVTHGVAIVTTHQKVLEELLARVTAAVPTSEIVGPTSLAQVLPNTPVSFTVKTSEVGNVTLVLWLIAQLCAEGWEVFQAAVEPTKISYHMRLR